MKNRPLAVNTALLAALSSPLITSAGEIETTVVTATRTEQSIAEVLAPVTVFERADIERIAPLDLQELLSRAAGISFVRNGGRGAATSLFVRGNQSNHTLLLVDGVRVGSATLGSPSLTNLPPELIERVEIVRGPRSALYGSEAIGGVINIITKKYHDLLDMFQPAGAAKAARKAKNLLQGRLRTPQETKARVAKNICCQR